MNASENCSSVVASIVTWNHAHCVEACIRSLLDQTAPPQEIVVYDNASGDETRQVLEKFRDRIRIIHSPENRGFCGGHNAVINATKSDLVLLVNPDIVLSKNYLENAVARMRKDPTIGTVCGLLLQSDPARGDCLVDGAGLNMSRSRGPILRYHQARLTEIKPESGPVFGVDGALPFYRRQMIENIAIDGQFFDPMFFAHKEDYDVSWRAQIYGWKAVFDPACVAIHPRHFKPGNLKLRKKLAPEIKYHAVKNDLLVLLHNEDCSNFFKDFLQIVPRQIAIFSYVLLFERSSLKAFGFVLKNLSKILRHRKVVMRNRKATPRQVRRQFLLDWTPS